MIGLSFLEVNKSLVTPFYMNETTYATSYSMHYRTRYRTSWSQVFIETNTSILATSDNNELLLHIHIKYRMDDAG